MLTGQPAHVSSPAVVPSEKDQTHDDATLTATEHEKLKSCLKLLLAPGDESKFVGLLMVCKLEGIGDKQFALDREEQSVLGTAQADDGEEASTTPATVRRVLFNAVGLKFLLRLLKTRRGNGPPSDLSLIHI